MAGTIMNKAYTAAELADGISKNTNSFGLKTNDSGMDMDCTNAVVESDSNSLYAEMSGFDQNYRMYLENVADFVRGISDSMQEHDKKLLK